MSVKLKTALGMATESPTTTDRNGFDDSHQLTEITRQYALNTEKLKKEAAHEFPTHVFPLRVQRILNCFHECDGYPADYYYTNALVAVAALLGVGYKARYRRGHEHYPILYAALVGNSSAGKGRSMKPVFSALFRIEKRYRDEYKAAYEAWQNEILFLDKKDKVPPKPIQREIIMDNATLESLIRTMYRNPRGLILNQEELLAWLKSMNAYRSGSDEQFWLKNWDAAFVKVTRSSQDTMSIENPNCSVIGGIQPALLHELLTDGKGDSGFSARILFAYPSETLAPMDNDQFPDQSVYDNWANIINWIDNLPNRIMYAQNEVQSGQVEEAVTIDCDDEAKSVYRSFFNTCARKMNDSDDDRIKSMMGKMQAYCMRFALILEILERASRHAAKATPQYATPFDEQGDEWDATDAVEPYSYADNEWEKVAADIKISGATMRNAKELTEYFIETGKKVLQRLETPVESLRPEQQSWYKALPIGEGFRYSVAKESAAKVRLSEATFKRLLNRADLFSRKKTTVNNREIEVYLRKWV